MKRNVTNSDRLTFWSRRLVLKLKIEIYIILSKVVTFLYVCKYLLRYISMVYISIYNIVWPFLKWIKYYLLYMAYTLYKYLAQYSTVFHIHKLQYANDHFFLKCTCKIYCKHFHDIIFQSSMYKYMQIFLMLLALQNR